jgi:hypothetical protein
MSIRTSFLSMLTGWTGTAWATLTMVPGDEGAGASSFGDSELQSFATAAVKVHLISDAYSQKMGEARSQVEKQQLEQRASSEMVQAVENEGLTVDKYHAIAKRLETDNDLAERVRQKLADAA